MNNLNRIRTLWKTTHLLGAAILCVVSFAGSAPAQCVLPSPGLVSWWSGDGNGTDIFGGSPGLPATNGVAFVPGMVGQAFSFDGTNGYIQTTLDVQPSAMQYSTWEAWVYPIRANVHLRALGAGTDATLPTLRLIDPNAEVFTNCQAQRF